MIFLIIKECAKNATATMIGIERGEIMLIRGKDFLACISDRNYDKKLKWPPYIIEDGCSLPSKLPEKMGRKVKTLIEKLIKTFQLKHCVMKLDLICKDNIIFVIEVAPWLGGGRLSSILIPMAYDIDWWSLALKVSLDLPIKEEELNPRHIRPAVQRYKFPEDKLKVTSHRSRLFSVEETGDTYEEALKKCEEKIK